MAVDETTVRRVARLARIAVTDTEVASLKDEVNAVISFVEQLGDLDVSDVAPMTGVIPSSLAMRPDAVNDGNIPELVLGNAPEREGDFFVVPKVVE